MNGMERITERIEADGRAEADGILAQARKSAEQITARYREEAAALQAALTARNKKAAADRMDKLIRAAQMEGRKLQLAARQAMVEQAFERALEKLRTLPEKEYGKLLAALLRRASVSGGGAVIFSPKDREGAGKRAVEQANAAGGALQLAKETRPMGRGFVLREGQTEVNCTFETLVRLQKEQMAGTVAKILFEEQGARRGKKSERH